MAGHDAVKSYEKKPLPIGKLLGITGAIEIAALIVLGIISEPEVQKVQDISKTLNEPGGMGEMNKTLSTTLIQSLIGRKEANLLLPWFS